MLLHLLRGRGGLSEFSRARVHFETGFWNDYGGGCRGK